MIFLRCFSSDGEEWGRTKYIFFLCVSAMPFYLGLLAWRLRLFPLAMLDWLMPVTRLA
jgi:hypothetical protein